jgi:hypothetical protein
VSGKGTCAAHGTLRFKTIKESSGHSHVHVALGSIKTLSAGAKGEMKRRLNSISRDIRSYFLGMGPYPEELGL